METLNKAATSWLVDQNERRMTRVLLGEFVATITPEEGNEWHEHLLTTHGPVRLKYTLAQYELEAAVKRGSPDELAAAVGRFHAAKDCLYYIGKAWYAELEKRRAQLPNSEGP